MRRSVTLLLGAGIALVATTPAVAAQVTIGVDDSVQAKPIWAPGEVTISPGDSVVWNLDSPIQPHEVASVVEPGTTTWSGLDVRVPAKTATYTFAEPGRYRFLCRLHSGDGTGGKTGMVGTVVVGNPPLPPPPPLSEQSFPNDSAITAGALETGGLDTTRPALRGVKAKKSGKRVKVSFRVSEQSIVTVRFARGGKTVKTKKAAVSSSGSVTVTGLKAGRYVARVGATDVAGNASSSRSASFRIR